MLRGPLRRGEARTRTRTGTGTGTGTGTPMLLRRNFKWPPVGTRKGSFVVILNGPGKRHAHAPPSFKLMITVARTRAAPSSFNLMAQPHGHGHAPSSFKQTVQRTRTRTRSSVAFFNGPAPRARARKDNYSFVVKTNSRGCANTGT